MDFQNFKWVDLTHTITTSSPTWNLDCGFKHEWTLDYDECHDPCKFRIGRYEMPAGMGTHMDVPAHCYPGMKSVHEMPLEELISPCIVIDVSKDAHADYKVDLSKVKSLSITKGSFVIFYTGWERFWNEPEKYHNNHRFPSIDEEVAHYLVEKGISGLGIDTLSPDTAESGFPVHQILLKAGKYMVENVANSQSMPAIGGFTLALPLKIFGGTEAPVRLIGAYSSLTK